MPAANRSPDAPLPSPTIASKAEKKKRKVKRNRGPRSGAYPLGFGC